MCDITYGPKSTMNFDYQLEKMGRDLFVSINDEADVTLLSHDPHIICSGEEDVLLKALNTPGVALALSRAISQLCEGEGNFMVDLEEARIALTGLGGQRLNNILENLNVNAEVAATVHNLFKDYRIGRFIMCMAINRLEASRHYTIDRETGDVEVTDEGRDFIAKFIGMPKDAKGNFLPLNTLSTLAHFEWAAMMVRFHYYNPDIAEFANIGVIKDGLVILPKQHGAFVLDTTTPLEMKTRKGKLVTTETRAVIYDTPTGQPARGRVVQNLQEAMDAFAILSEGVKDEVKSTFRFSQLQQAFSQQTNAEFTMKYPHRDALSATIGDASQRPEWERIGLQVAVLPKHSAPSLIPLNTQLYLDSVEQIPAIGRAVARYNNTAGAIIGVYEKSDMDRMEAHLVPHLEKEGYVRFIYDKTLSVKGNIKKVRNMLGLEESDEKVVKVLFVLDDRTEQDEVDIIQSYARMPQVVSVVNTRATRAFDIGVVPDVLIVEAAPAPSEDAKIQLAGRAPRQGVPGYFIGIYSLLDCKQLAGTALLENLKKMGLRGNLVETTPLANKVLDAIKKAQAIETTVTSQIRVHHAEFSNVVHQRNVKREEFMRDISSYSLEQLKEYLRGLINEAIRSGAINEIGKTNLMVLMMRMDTLEEKDRATIVKAIKEATTQKWAGYLKALEFALQQASLEGATGIDTLTKFKEIEERVFDYYTQEILFSILFLSILSLDKERTVAQVEKTPARIVPLPAIPAAERAVSAPPYIAPLFIDIEKIQLAELPQIAPETVRQLVQNVCINGAAKTTVVPFKTFKMIQTSGVMTKPEKAVSPVEWVTFGAEGRTDRQVVIFRINMDRLGDLNSAFIEEHLIPNLKTITSDTKVIIVLSGKDSSQMARLRQVYSLLKKECPVNVDSLAYKVSPEISKPEIINMGEWLSKLQIRSPAIILKGLKTKILSLRRPTISIFSLTKRLSKISIQALREELNSYFASLFISHRLQPQTAPVLVLSIATPLVMVLTSFFTVSKAWVYGGAVLDLTYNNAPVKVMENWLSSNNGVVVGMDPDQKRAKDFAMDILQAAKKAGTTTLVVDEDLIPATPDEDVGDIIARAKEMGFKVKVLTEETPALGIKEGERTLVLTSSKGAEKGKEKISSTIQTLTKGKVATIVIDTHEKLSGNDADTAISVGSNPLFKLLGRNSMLERLYRQFGMSFDSTGFGDKYDGYVGLTTEPAELSDDVGSQLARLVPMLDDEDPVVQLKANYLITFIANSKPDEARRVLLSMNATEVIAELAQSVPGFFNEKNARELISTIEAAREVASSYEERLGSARDDTELATLQGEIDKAQGKITRLVNLWKDSGTKGMLNGDGEIAAYLAKAFPLSSKPQTVEIAVTRAIASLKGNMPDALRRQLIKQHLEGDESATSILQAVTQDTSPKAREARRAIFKELHTAWLNGNLKAINLLADYAQDSLKEPETRQILARLFDEKSRLPQRIASKLEQEYGVDMPSGERDALIQGEIPKRLGTEVAPLNSVIVKICGSVSDKIANGVFVRSFNEGDYQLASQLAQARGSIPKGITYDVADWAMAAIEKNTKDKDIAVSLLKQALQSEAKRLSGGYQAVVYRAFGRGVALDARDLFRRIEAGLQVSDLDKTALVEALGAMVQADLLPKEYSERAIAIFLPLLTSEGSEVSMEDLMSMLSMLGGPQTQSQASLASQYIKQLLARVDPKTYENIMSELEKESILTKDEGLKSQLAGLVKWAVENKKQPYKSQREQIEKAEAAKQEKLAALLERRLGEETTTTTAPAVSAGKATTTTLAARAYSWFSVSPAAQTSLFNVGMVNIVGAGLPQQQATTQQTAKPATGIV
ncbi:MAG: hypothetical protein FJZ16_05125, partial [Candidatus Omnitrophica bacterium]|nr:hypothetical protein [Candidatus Omnitrophota bacterium]